MDSRERTFMALNFEEPDRVPTDLWMSGGFRRKLEAALGLPAEQFLERHDVDLRYIEGPAYCGPPLPQFADQGDEDIWGVRRQRVRVAAPGGAEVYEEVARSPLAGAASVEEIEAYDRWPSPDWFDYSRIESQCQAIRDQGRVAVFMGDRLNRLAQLKPAMYLRGIEQLFADLVVAPQLARALFARIREFYEAYAERIFAAARGKLDLLLTGDDFGSQNGLLVSPAMWAEFLQTGFSRYIEIARGHGLKVMHHTCGGVRPLIPLMLDSGLDVLQSLQPEAAGMEPRALKAAFGDRLAFHGGISVQRTLPFGTPGQVRREVRDRVEALAPGGGYILGTAHNLQADVPVANALALVEGYREWGRYR
jgi:uroporphyrinogen decarboxylase